MYNNSEIIIIVIVFVLAELLKRMFKVNIYHTLKEKIYITLFTFVIFVAWELLNLHVGHAWVYPGNGLLGYNIFQLPLEMYLFYLVGPYFTFVIFEVIHHVFDWKRVVVTN